MRLPPFYVVLVALMMATPAFAGSVTYADGKGSWQSTACKKPDTAGAVVVAGSEDAADSINAQVTRQGQMADLLRAYQQCLSDEATRDAAATSQLITSVATEQMKNAAAEMQLRFQQAQPAAEAESK